MGWSLRETRDEGRGPRAVKLFPLPTPYSPLPISSAPPRLGACFIPAKRRKLTVLPARAGFPAFFLEISLERPGALARSTAHVRSGSGRRQERLARRDDRPSGEARRQRAGRFRHHRRGLSPVHRPERTGRTHLCPPR